jgi:photosystem II stability/assembly factor-like uncharacterized protein
MRSGDHTVGSLPAPRRALGVAIARITAALAAPALSLAAQDVPVVVVPVTPPGTLVSVRYVAVDPNHPGTVYAASSDQFPFPSAKVHKSTDSGVTWVEVGRSLLHDATFEGITVDSESNVFVNSSGDGLHRSSDGGATWSPSLGFVGTSITADFSSPGRIYALWPNGVGRSEDGGITFTDISAGLPIPRPQDPQGPGVSTLTVDPTESTVLYVGMFEKGIYKSTDDGSSWHALEMGFEPSGVVAVAVDPNNSSVVFAGTAEDGLLKSADGGAHWASVSTGQPNPQFFALAFDKNSTLYAGVYDHGVLVSTDGGVTWTDGTPALPSNYIMTLVADPATPGRVYVGGVQ